MPPVFTIGHSTRTAEELLALLAEHGVEVLVDVRRYPGSRRHPQFSCEALDATLAGAGIEYMHEPDLGGRRAPRKDSPHTAWRVEAFRGYADHMETEPFQAALERLIGLSAQRRVVILCAEAVPWRCHRRLISDALVARGLDVRHILGRGRADPHDIDANARLLDGGRRLVYSGPADAQGNLFEST
jgi:uncharacterized protein (DUF488 family)